MKRIQRKRTKGWKMPATAKYVGRPSKWGNPFRLTTDGYIQCYSTNRKILDPWIMWSVSPGFDMEDIIYLYGRWLDGKLKGAASYLPIPPSIEELRGKNLACFCPMERPCHADVILEKLEATNHAS